MMFGSGPPVGVLDSVVYEAAALAALELGECIRSSGQTGKTVTSALDYCTKVTRAIRNQLNELEQQAVMNGSALVPPTSDVSQELLEWQLFVLSRLTPREVVVIEQRFGFGARRPRTLRDVGLELHVRPERVRQIEAKALRKLRHPANRGRADMLIQSLGMPLLLGPLRLLAALIPDGPPS